MDPSHASRLTSLAHGGGCGCKLSPPLLRTLLAGVAESGAAGGLHPALLVGLETGDDAAVYRLNDTQALVATTDFFTPIVDDPYEFGRIAATNALSDVYAMGGTPILALALLGMPLGRLAPEIVSRILAGGAAACAAVGIPVAGGHSIDSPEPIYGLVALGLVHPDRIRRNDGARPGDAMVLTKPIGIGVCGAALRRDALSGAGYDAMIRAATAPNAVGPALAAREGVRAITDVTGFGLLGHALEMCRGAGCGAEIDAGAVPLLHGVEALAREGVRTGAASRNWDSAAAETTHGEELPAWRRDLLCDPQTSGGLLLAVDPDDLDGVLALLRTAGFAEAAAIGRFREGSATIRILA